MSKNDNAFWDFCKAENSEDEDGNNDLQSRLYAEIYYAPVGQEILITDTKNSNTESEFIATNDYQTLTNDSFDKRCTVPNSLTPLNKSQINSDSDTQKNERSSAASMFKTKQSTPKSKTEGQRVIENLDHDNIEDLETSEDGKSKKPTLNVPIAMGANDLASLKKETEVEIRKLKTTSNSEVTILKVVEVSSTTCMSHAGSTKVTAIETESTTNLGNGSSKNILKKYEFSKSFMNKLYLEKYKNLNKKLKEQEQRELNEQLTAETTEARHDSDKDTRYNVLDKNQKNISPIENDSDVVVILSESDTDSEDSILEVPVPPKPKPPVINVKDSDDELESDSDCDIHLDVGNLLNDTAIVSEELRNDAESLTCTDAVSKQFASNDASNNADDSNILEITETSNNIPLEECSSKESKSDQPQSKKLRCSEKGMTKHPFISEDNNWSELQTVKDIESNSSDIILVEDIIPIREQTPKKLSSDRKRHCPDEAEASTSAKQIKYSDDKTDDIQTNIQPQKSGQQEEGTTVLDEDHFVRPMPISRKFHYAEVKRLQVFDMVELQSKMSKDPKLWRTIAADSKSAAAKRNRFWNARCTYCRREGHQRQNCPEPRKPQRCHMCGKVGHTEARCPQKMCLSCGRKQGSFRKTCENCRTLFCNMCNAIGHKSTTCPDLWRRFHQTTRDCEINVPENLSQVMKPPHLLYCCNCTQRGHDSSICTEYRWSHHFPTPAFVSSYVDVPGCSKKRPRTNSNEGDVAPSASYNIPNVPSRPAKKVRLIIEHNDPDISEMIYFCGEDYPIFHEIHEIKRDISHVKMYNVEGIISGRTSPQFLEKLLEMETFDVKMYYNKDRKLILKIRARNLVTKSLYDLILHWLQLEEDEQQRIIRVDLPTSKNELISFISMNLNLLENDSYGDPRSISKQIARIKRSLANIKDPTKLSLLGKRLSENETRLLRIFHTRLEETRECIRLKNIFNDLQSPQAIMHVGLYIRICLLHNQLFMPYSIKPDKLNQFFLRYYQCTKKPKKTKNNTYQKFINSINNTASQTVTAQKKSVSVISKANTSTMTLRSSVVHQKLQQEGTVDHGDQHTRYPENFNPIVQLLEDSTEVSNMHHVRNMQELCFRNSNKQPCIYLNNPHYTSFQNYLPANPQGVLYNTFENMQGGQYLPNHRKKKSNKSKKVKGS